MGGGGENIVHLFDVRQLFFTNPCIFLQISTIQIQNKHFDVRYFVTKFHWRNLIGSSDHWPDGLKTSVRHPLIGFHLSYQKK
jgi:hypothetical protein